jgi:BirA family biotin operon repressor/biotin-[acetyl-CoA-carboxylase] ligase
MLRFHLPQTDSTNDEARRRAAEHPGRLLLVVADTQTAGRGQRGRIWRSPPGGAWFSLVVPAPRPGVITPLRVGGALRRVLSAYVEPLDVRPPNDILHRDRKLAGVLCEQTVSARTPGRDAAPPEHVIVGVGINANFAAAALGDGLRTPPVSLLDLLEREVDLPQLIDDAARVIVEELAAQPPIFT